MGQLGSAGLLPLRRDRSGRIERRLLFALTDDFDPGEITTSVGAAAFAVAATGPTNPKRSGPVFVGSTTSMPSVSAVIAKAATPNSGRYVKGS